MHRLIICAFAVISLNSFGAAGPASSSGNSVPSFLRLVHGRSHPEISVRNFAVSTPDTLFDSGDEVLCCVFVGHTNPHVRQQVLDDAEQSRNFFPTDHNLPYMLVDRVYKNALKFLSVEELTHSQLSITVFLAACCREQARRTTLNACGKYNEKLWDDGVFVLPDRKDPVVRYPRHFDRTEIVQELLFRERSGTCAPSVLSNMFRKQMKEEGRIGFEIDYKKLSAYFEKRIAAGTN